MANQKRLEQLNSEIEKYLATILRELKDPRITGLVSVQQVDLTRDFSHCTVFVSIFNSENEQDCFNAILNSVPHIRRELAKDLSIRIVPELHFKLDKSLDYVSKIENILKETKK